jgi:hypothetical protein
MVATPENYLVENTVRTKVTGLRDYIFVTCNDRLLYLIFRRKIRFGQEILLEKILAYI